jgi:hypothetical protein
MLLTDSSRQTLPNVFIGRTTNSTNLASFSSTRLRRESHDLKEPDPLCCLCACGDMVDIGELLEVGRPLAFTQRL